MKMILTIEEMSKLAHAWEFHRNSLTKCTDAKDVIIEYRDGGSIGTRVFLVCGCGKEIDITDYNSW